MRYAHLALSQPALLVLPLDALLAQLTPSMLDPLPFLTCVLMSRDLLAVHGLLVLLSC